MVFTRISLGAALFVALIGLSGCGGHQESLSAVAKANDAVAQSLTEYRLGTGDEIKLVVYGEDDLSGQYQVSSTGVVALPLVGSVKAAGLTIQEFENSLRARLATGYLKDPRVSAQVATYRPFFILGEVQKPSSYPYVNGMTVMTAVAVAGGYTYRADKSDIHIVRASDPTKQEVEIGEEAVIMPGDILRVPERFF